MKATDSIPEFDDVTPWGAYRPKLFMAALLFLGQSMPNILGFVSKAARHPIKYWTETSVDLSIWGLKLRLNPRGNISEQKLYTSPRNFDSAELKYMKSFLKNGGVFFDIGANAGIYSFWAHVCSKGRARILGFEPDVEMRRRIDFNVKSNDIRSIRVLPYALSDRNGVSTFYLNEHQRGTNSLEMPASKITNRRQIEVQLQTLAAVIRDQSITSIDVMKIDIEGHEPPVLRHFFSNVSKEVWPRLLIGEVQHMSADEFANLVPAEYYEIVSKTKLNTIWKLRQ
jgi:FkbM family methyltransferase